MTVKQTRDYSIFRNHPNNRDLDKPNLNRIISSIKSKNMLEFRPIIVNKNFEVIDGQHRLEAAKSLGIDIWYCIDDSTQIEDMILLNVNQKVWMLEDYLRHHSSLGKEDYLALEKFMEEESIDCRQALRLMNMTSKERMVKFKAGNFLFPKGSEYVTLMDELHKYKLIMSIIKNNKIDGPNFCNKSGLKKALLEMLKIDELDFDTFKAKLLINMDKVRICGNSLGYLNMFKTIYNWKNRFPLE